MANLVAIAALATIRAARDSFSTVRLPRQMQLVLVGLAACAVLLLAGAERVEAATFVVVDGSAVGDGEPGDGICRSKLRPGTLQRDCTLMAAIEESNALSGHHTILLPAGVYRFDRFRISDVRLLVTGRMTIIGAGAATTEITSTGLFDNAITVKPGAIFELRNVTYRDNGPLANEAGTLIINNSIIRNNKGAAGGIVHEGGIGSIGVTTILNSRITGNEALSAGGGLSVDFGLVTIENSAIDANFAPDSKSGGIEVKAGTLKITNSTVSGNRSRFGVGGIRFLCCDLEINSVTIANNTGVGLGAFNGITTGEVLMNNTLLTNNTGSIGLLNCSADFGLFYAIPRPNHNLDSDNSCRLGATGLQNNLINVNPLLGPLQFNGGPTPTHAIPAGSPAVDTGSCLVLTDQRGHARPLDGDGNGVDQCDIGAFEKVRARPGTGGVGVPILNPAGSTVQVNDTLTQTFAWDLPAPTNWGGLGTMDFRLRSNGTIVYWVHWDQVLDTYQLFDVNGRPIGFALRPGLDVPLSAGGVTLDVRGVRTQGSGITGTRVTLTLPLRFDASTAGRVFTIEVSASDDEGRQDPFRQLGTITVVTAPGVGPNPNNDDKDDARRLTETQRHQQSRTNRSGLDDERVEGNVVSVRADLPTPEVDIANRDGVVTLRLVKDAKSAAKDLQPGDYVSGDGWKEHEYLYWIDQLDVER